MIIYDVYVYCILYLIRICYDGFSEPKSGPNIKFMFTERKGIKLGSNPDFSSLIITLLSARKSRSTVIKSRKNLCHRCLARVSGFMNGRIIVFGVNSRVMTINNCNRFYQNLVYCTSYCYYSNVRW